MLEVNGNSERLGRSYNELVELQLVLEKAGSFFDQARVDAQGENLDRAYSVPEDMGAPLLEAALPVSGGQVCCGFSGGGGRREARPCVRLLLWRRLLCRRRLAWRVFRFSEWCSWWWRWW